MLDTYIQIQALYMTHFYNYGMDNSSLRLTPNIKLPYSKKHWWYNNFGKLQQFTNFLPIFTISIIFPMQIDFNSPPKFFLPNFLQCLLFAKFFTAKVFYYTASV